MVASLSLSGRVATLALVLVSLLPSLCAQSLSFTTLTLATPWPGRQQGGLLILGSSPAAASNVALTNGSSVGVFAGSAFVWGGQNCSSIASCVPSNDVWFSPSAAQVLASKRVAFSVSTNYLSQGYGPATCADPTGATLYSLGGDISPSEDKVGTNTVYYSSNFGGTWGSFSAPWPGRTDALCFVDSHARLYVLGGKHADPSGDAVSNDVWQGSYPTGFGPASMTWTQQAANAPFPASDGLMGATFFSSTLGTDVLYVGGGYTYTNAAAQNGDNGVGWNEVYVSLNQGITWTSIGHAAWPTRYHGKWLAASNGVLAVFAGATEAPPTNGGSSQISSVFLNDFWASVDGGFTWGLCNSAIFPSFSASTPNSQYQRGAGREDPLAAIDPTTGLVYIASGIQFNPQATGVAFPSDAFVSSASFLNPSQVASACSNLSIPSNGVGLQVAPPFSLIALTAVGPFLPRQQGGMYVVPSSPSTLTPTLNFVGSSVTIQPAASSLIIYGGTLPGQTGQTPDVWYSANGTSYSLISNGAFTSQSYGPAACSDSLKQILYSIGGDTNGGDSAGTNQVWASTNLGQTWTQSTGTFPGRGNAVCVVDSHSRVFVAGGKQVNTNGVGVSNDVWMGVLTSTSPVTLTWTAQSLTAPFTPRDGPSAATYYSPSLGLDLLYYSAGYSYLNVVAQYQGDSGVGNNDVWLSTTLGQTWFSLGLGAFPPRYHAKMVATYQGVLVMVAGANDLPPTQGGSSQVSSILRNDWWASLDGGYTWGQCGSQVYPLNNPAITGSLYTRGTGREDPVLQIDNSTGFIYTGMGLQRNPTGGAVSPQDLFRSSISFYDVPAVAGLCGDQTIPLGGVGLQNVPPFSFVPLTLSGPFNPRQQGGLYVVNTISQNVATTLTVVNGATFQAAPSSLVIFGGHTPVGSNAVTDIWYSGNPTTYQQIVQTTFPSEAYGPASCVDQYNQILYSIGGDQSSSGGDKFGTNMVYSSIDLGQTWTGVAATFPGRANAVCVVDSFSRVFVIGGKLANSTGEDVSNDVWVGTPISSNPLSLSWAQASASAPWTPRDGPSAATYFSVQLNVDVLYLSGGYYYTNAVAQSQDNGVGINDVWLSTTQGKTWALLGFAAFGPRYHSKMLATQAGVLVMLAGNNAPPTTNGGANQGSSFTLNDMWTSLDGGYTWGQCGGQIFPLYQPSISAASYARGTGREDPVLQIDYTTGYLYTGMGLQYAANGTAESPKDLFKSSISFYDVAAVGALCGTQSIPVGGTGLLVAPPLSLVPLTLSGPFSPRQQGGLYAVNTLTQNVATTLTVVNGGTFQAVPSSLIIFGGHVPGQKIAVNDIWYSGNQTTYRQVVQTSFPSEAYGPATCSDPYKQILYSIGGDQSGGDTAGTNQVYSSTDLGQTWTQSTGSFPGRANAVCVVDSYSRVYLIGGKLANSTGDAVSNDVWVGSPSGSSLSWSQASAAAPFTPRDGPSAATYFSVPLNLDVVYLSTGYIYQNSAAQSQDNGVGTNDVWVSTTQGQTWTLLTNAAFPLRYHSKMLATQAGVLVMVAGANAPPTTNGGLSQGSEFVLNDLYTSLDGGYTWGQCASNLFPSFDSTITASSYTLGNGREDPVLQIDYATGYLYTGLGLQYAANGTQTMPADMFKTSISFYDVPAVAGLCNLTQPAVTGLQSTPTPTQSGNLCLIFYSLPGNIDYPWSSATFIQFSYNPVPVATPQGTAVTITNGTGTRTFTNRFGTTSSTPLTIYPQNVQGSDNFLYLGSSFPLDVGGITWQLSSLTQLAGNGPNNLVIELNIFNNSGVIVEGSSTRIDNLGQAFLSNVPGFQNVTIGASNINSLAPNYAACQAPITFTNGLRVPTQPSASNGALRFAYGYTISDGATYTVTASLIFTTTSGFATTIDQLGNPYQSVVNITGTRSYTYLPTGASQTSAVVGVSLAQFASADQRFYPYALLSSAPGTYSINTAPFFDFDGVEFAVNPPVSALGAAPGSGTQFPAVELFFSTPVSLAILTEGSFKSGVPQPNVALQQQTYSLLS